MNTNTSDGISQPSAWGTTGGDAYATLGEEETASSVSSGLYFFITWSVLLLLITASACLIAAHRYHRVRYAESSGREEPQNDSEAPTQEIESQPSNSSADCAKDEPTQEHVPLSNYLISAKTSDNIGYTIILVGAVIGMGLSIFSMATCEFVDLRMPSSYNVNVYGDQHWLTIYSLGLWSAEVGSSNLGLSGCMRDISPLYSGRVKGISIKLAQASGVLGCVFGVVSLLSTLGFMSCRVSFNIRHLRWLFLLAFTFQLSTLSIFGTYHCVQEWWSVGSSSYFSDGNNCSASIGAVASITSAIYWGFGGLASFLLPFSATE